ncbi:MAG TPA: hypothetical protein VJ732_01640 [Bryobacteraceae bacterium]|nr:hypothetical protein [Bryobacteraceae bacterium]
MRRYLGAFLLTAALMAPVVARADHDDHSEHERNRQVQRYYDPYARDYHYWTPDEERSYRDYLRQQHREYREWNRLNEREQRQYWEWRHHHHDRDDRDGR